MNRYLLPFTPIVSTGPSFETSALNNNATSYALESSAVSRVWAGPGGRSVRILSHESTKYYLAFGSSTITVGATDGILVRGDLPIVLGLPTAGNTYVAIFSSATGLTANITLGYGG